VFRCALLLLIALVANPASASAATIAGEVQDVSEFAGYEVQVVTSLDLTQADQPVARGPVAPDGSFAVEYEPDGGPYWVFLHQRFQPTGAPKFELYLPEDLLPRYDPPAGPIVLRPVDPELLMTRQRFSVEPGVLKRMFVACLLVFGGGFGMRRLTRSRAAPEGARSAPLADLSPPPGPSRREQIAIGVIVALAFALRMPGFFTESLDLLEVSYLPGIGRPAPFAAGLTGFPAIPFMLGELMRMHCLDLTHPPGYHAVMVVMGLFGTAGWILRLPGLLCSLLCCWLMWRFFSRWSPRAGLACAFAYAVVAPSIYFGQDATPYAAVGVVTLGSVMLMMRALQEGRTKLWSAYFATIVVGFSFHYNVALLGVTELALLCALAWRGRDDRRWGAAMHRAMRPALLWAPWPIGWAWLHFSTFDTIAQDTRLVADVYMPDPGVASYTWDFWTVMSGIDVGTSHWSALAVVGLVGLALARVLRPNEGDPPQALGIVLAALTVGFVASVLFFYVNVVDALAGHVFYGFRWVGCFLPVVVGVATLGAVEGRGSPVLRATLAAVWGVGVLLATTAQVTGPSRPAYEEASDLIRSELKDRDGLATLPAWFQRGTFAYYLLNRPGVQRVPDEGESVWLIDGRKVVVEAVHSSLPFETTALSSHVDRLWVAVVDERMSGRTKFQLPIADQGLAWADAHLVREGEWTFDRIRLVRYRRPDGALRVEAGDVLKLSSEHAVLSHRLYPPLQGKPTFVPPEQIPTTLRLGPALKYQAPMSPGCVDWRFRGLKASLVPAADHHWYFDLRIPTPPGPAPSVTSRREAQIDSRRTTDAILVKGVGGPCDGPPLEVMIH